MLRRQRVSVAAIGIGSLALVAFAGGCGIFVGGSAINSRPTEFIVWGDPATDVQSRDVFLGRNEDSTGNQSRLAIATDGQVVLEDGNVCENCVVDSATAQLTVEGEVRGTIRWIDIAGEDRVLGTSDDGRAPFLVGTDNIILEVISSSSGVTFRRTDRAFDDDASDDTAFEAGVFVQEGNATGGSACGEGGLLGGLLGLILLSYGPMRRRVGRAT